jgi:hypothetical protein
VRGVSVVAIVVVAALWGLNVVAPDGAGVAVVDDAALIGTELAVV